MPKFNEKTFSQSRRDLIRSGAWSALSFGLMGCDIRMHNSPFETNVPNVQLNVTNVERINQLNLGSEFKVALLSDSHFYFGNFHESISHINQRSDIDFIIHAGDYTNLGDAWEYKTALEIVKSSNIPVLSVPGNHDFISKGKEVYKKAFGPYNYYLKTNTHLLIFANTNRFEFQREGLDQDWFDNVISEHLGSLELIVIAHIPPTDAEAFSAVEQSQIIAKLNTYNLRLFLHGHYNHYSRNEVNGVYFLNAAGQGDPRYSVITIKTGYQYDVEEWDNGTTRPVFSI